MPALNAYPQSSAQPVSAVALPSAATVWQPAHYFHRVPDLASFAWLNSLNPAAANSQPQVAKCFGMDVAYLTLDLLRWFPNETLLAIPYVPVTPPEYFFVCNSGGQRWWCFVVLRKQGETTTALVFDTDPSVLIIVGLGLRETHVNPSNGETTHRQDFAISPNPAVLCPMDDHRIVYQRMSPETGEYFRVSEGDSMGGSSALTLADLLGTKSQRPAKAFVEVSVGSPVFGVKMGINDDVGLMRLVESLSGSGAGGVL